MTAAPQTPPLDLKDLCGTLRSTVLSCDHGASSCDRGATSCDRGATSCDHKADHIHCSDSRAQKRRRVPSEEKKLSPTKKRKLNYKHRTRPLEPVSPENRLMNGDETDSGCCSCSWNQVTDSAYELMSRCLDLNPQTRITAEQGLQHPFLTDASYPNIPDS